MSDFDPAKDAINCAKHGISLARWVDIDMQVTLKDKRRDYGEDRYRAYGYIDGLPYCLVFADRNGKVRPISLRRAHMKEIRRHVT
ncbi:BrnT family toxin [Rhodopseudomonas palustris]|uniref:BrnT family toxin n=1 Tax=Rhodopseudomonas palustris (strain DX-1) TaxID=652103 RepID=E6VHL4_RHOPX|nr:BrnT family toxin [Rhodopseudomonas palustris]